MTLVLQSCDCSLVPDTQRWKVSVTKPPMNLIWPVTVCIPHIHVWLWSLVLNTCCCTTWGDIGTSICPEHSTLCRYTWAGAKHSQFVNKSLYPHYSERWSEAKAAGIKSEQSLRKTKILDAWNCMSSSTCIHRVLHRPEYLLFCLANPKRP